MTDAPENNTPTPAPATPELTPHQQFLQMLPEDLRTDPSFIKFDGDSANAIVGNLANSYTNLQKLVGADKAHILKFPTSEDDKESWDEVYSKLGRPEKQEDYFDEKYKSINGFDETSFKEISKVAHENGVSKKALQAIVETYLSNANATQQLSQEQTDATLSGYNDQLKQNWGQAYDIKVDKVLNTLKEKATPEFLQLASDFPTIFDHPAVMQTLDNLLKMSEEAGQPNQGGSSGSAPLSPDEAKAQINAFNADTTKQAILLKADHPMRDAVLKEREKLFKYAYPQ